MAAMKRWLVVGVCLGLAVARLAWPDLRIDAVTIWLVGLAAAVALLPDLRSVVPFVKRLKVGEMEIELRRLEREVAEAAEAVSGRADVGDDARTHVDDVLREAGRDPRAALLLLSSKLEQQVRERLRTAGVKESSKFMGLLRLVQAGVEGGVFPATLVPAVRDFWLARNEVAHGRAFEVPDATLLSLLSIGTELLATLSARPAGDARGAA